jgi:cobalt-zinc-cadmium efflux system outer membrane protein
MMRYFVRAGWVSVVVLSLSQVGFAGEVLTFEQAWRMALENRQGLQAARLAVNRQDALVRQSRVRPNPSFAFQTENWRFTQRHDFSASNDVDWFAYWTQPLEARGKREARSTLASLEREATELEARKFEWDLWLEVRRAFLDAAFVSRELEEALREERLQQTVRDYYARRFELGAVGELDYRQAELELQVRQLEISRLRRQVGVTLASLGRVMGFERFPEGYDSVRLEAMTALASGGVAVDELIRTAWRERLDLQLESVQGRIQEARTRVERLKGHPDWDVILGYKRTEGFNTLLAGIIVPLPLWDRNLGAVEASLVEENRWTRLHEDARRQAASEVRSALLRFRDRYVGRRELGEKLVPAAEENWSIVQEAFAEGMLDFLRVLDARRTVASLRRMLIQAEMELEMARLEIAAAVGTADPAVGEATLADLGKGDF